jgi:hypothetical protein
LRTVPKWWPGFRELGKTQYVAGSTLVVGFLNDDGICVEVEIGPA